MQRIAVIGCSGGGKSTLVQNLAARRGLPVIHLDVLYWAPGWVGGDYEVFRRHLTEAVSGERWITDGNFPDSADLHFARADLIVWVDQPRLLCLWRVIWRVIATGGGRRPDLPEGCQERFDPWLWSYVWNWDRDTRPKVEIALAEHAPKTPLVRLRSDQAAAAWLSAIEAPLSRS